MKRRYFSVLGYFLSFIAIAAMVFCAITVYKFIQDLGDWRIMLIMIVVVVILAAFSTLCDYLRKRFIDERVSDDIAAAAELMAKGDFNIPLTPRHTYKKYDEYDRIMESINLLAGELSKTEILRNDFVSNVSHEIKTPLSVISNYAYALKKGGLDTETREKYLDTLISASLRLSDLVTNILKLNKLEHSTSAAKPEEFELGETIRECVLSFEEKIDEKNLGLDCEIEDMVITSDRGLIETVVNNLISNAVKYTPENGKIKVELKGGENTAVIRVTDTGCGIDRETGAHIFDKFYQGDTSHASEGNGLGLAMVKRIVDILGGTIKVSSEKGKGSVFTITLKTSGQGEQSNGKR